MEGVLLKGDELLQSLTLPEKPEDPTNLIHNPTYILLFQLNTHPIKQQLKSPMVTVTSIMLHYNSHVPDQTGY